MNKIFGARSDARPGAERAVFLEPHDRGRPPGARHSEIGVAVSVSGDAGLFGDDQAGGDRDNSGSRCLELLPDEAATPRVGGWPCRRGSSFAEINFEEHRNGR
jgi:hypothetical protein